MAEPGGLAFYKQAKDSMLVIAGILFGIAALLFLIEKVIDSEILNLYWSVRILVFAAVILIAINFFRI